MSSVVAIPFVAGHVALDFVNTADEGGVPGAQDTLQTAADLLVWGQRSGLLTDVAIDTVNPPELTAAIEARELLYGVLLSRVRDQRPPTASLAQLSRLTAGAYEVAELTEADDGRLTWHWDPTQLSSVRHVAVTSAVQLLSQSPAPRLKQCPGDRCGWFFLDATKRGNRRWCSMGDCGQEAKTARRRERAAR